MPPQHTGLSPTDTAGATGADAADNNALDVTAVATAVVNGIVTIACNVCVVRDDVAMSAVFASVVTTSPSIVFRSFQAPVARLEWCKGGWGHSRPSVAQLPERGNKSLGQLSAFDG